MGKGRDYELDLLRDVRDVVDDRYVWATLPDYSGVAAGTFCDLAIIFGVDYHGHVHGAFIEVKKRKGEEGYRKTVMSGSSKGETGREELERLIDGCPNWGEPYVAIKFDHREIIVLHAKDLLYYLENGEEPAEYSREGANSSWDAEQNFHDARFTDSDSISMRKPALSYWESSTAGADDHRKILEQVGGDEISYDPPSADEFDIQASSEIAEA